MKNLIYYFVFENDYMIDIINRLSSIFNVSQEENSMIYKDELEQVYVLNAMYKGMACILAKNSSYIYAVYIFSKFTYQQEIEKMLDDLCDEIQDEYGEDRRKFIKNIMMDEDVMIDCIKTAKKFGYDNMLENYIGVFK